MTNEPTIKGKDMEELPSSILHALKSIELPSDAHARMRADLSAYADLYEIQDTQASAPRRFAFSALVLRTRTVYASALALVIIVAGGTQVTSAAEDAVPGDILYPIKVSLTEPLALALSGSERKAEFAAEFASRRVIEAATLSEKGKLDEKTADTLAVNFSKHVDTVTKETGALEAKGDVAFSLAIRTDLEQKIASRVEDIVPDVAPAAMSASMVAIEADSAPESAQTFAVRVSEKSRQLALTRERIEAVIAVDASTEADAPVSLAALREAAKPDAAMTRLFTAKVPGGEGEPVPAAASTSTTTATSTATTTEPAVEKAAEPAAQRFFAPFLKR